MGIASVPFDTVTKTPQTSVVYNNSGLFFTQGKMSTVVVVNIPFIILPWRPRLAEQPLLGTLQVSCQRKKSHDKPCVVS